MRHARDSVHPRRHFPLDCTIVPFRILQRVTPASKLYSACRILPSQRITSPTVMRASARSSHLHSTECPASAAAHRPVSQHVRTAPTRLADIPVCQATKSAESPLCRSLSGVASEQPQSHPHAKRAHPSQSCLVESSVNNPASAALWFPPQRDNSRRQVRGYSGATATQKSTRPPTVMSK